MFLTICYLSSASDKLTIEDLESLMIEAKEFNNANNIRGVLIYSDQTFFQIIEGEYDKIKLLFEKILKDNRIGIMLSLRYWKESLSKQNIIDLIVDI